MRTLLVALLLSTTLHAGVSILTGNIKDAQGNPVNGTLVMRLPIPAQDPTTQSAIAPVPVTFQLVNGAVTGGAPLYDLGTIQPQKLWYSARAYDTTGTLVFYGNYYVTGATFNLGNATPTVVTTSNISFAPIPLGGAGFGTIVGNSVQSTINAIAAAGSGAPVVIPQGYTFSQNFTNPTFLPILNFSNSPNGDYDKNGVQPVDIFGVRHDGQTASCTFVTGNTQITCFSQTNPFTQADVGKLLVGYFVGPTSLGGVFVNGTASGGTGGIAGTQPLVTTNGGCQYPMRGWVTVSGGAASGAITTWEPAYGCTSPPTTATVGTVTGTVTISGISAVSTDLATSIVSVQNGSTVTLADAPSFSFSVPIVYGTDDAAALTAACNGRGLAQNGGHFTHVGISMISKGVVCDGNNVWIQGAGWAPLTNAGGGSTIFYAGKNLSGTDAIWITSQGWGAKLTDIGLRGNSYARPRGLEIAQGTTPHGNGNSAAGAYDHLWIGWMYGDNVGPSTSSLVVPAISKGIWANVPTGNGDFNFFGQVYINGAIQGIDGNNDQATAWSINQLQIQHSYVGICDFNYTAINLYFTEFNGLDINLGPCETGTSGFPTGLTINNYGGESSAQNIKYGTNNGNAPVLIIHTAGFGQPPQYLDPSGVVVDLSQTINSGSIILGDQAAVNINVTGGENAFIALPTFGETGLGPTMYLNSNLTATHLIAGASNAPSQNNADSNTFTFKHGNFYSANLNLDNKDWNSTIAGFATPVPSQQNDFKGTVRDFGSMSVLSPRPPGQTDNVSVKFFGLNAPAVVGTSGSTTYNYIVTCSDQAGNETNAAPQAQGYGYDFNSAFGVEVRTTTGPASLSTSNYITVSALWTQRGCAFYNFYGDEGSGAIGYLTTITADQWASNLTFADQGQYTKNTGRTPPLQTTSGTLKVEGPTILSSKLSIADKGTCTMAAGTCSAQNLVATYTAAPTCLATYTGTGTLAGTIKITSTTTTVTPASTTGTDTAVVNWACLGN